VSITDSISQPQYTVFKVNAPPAGAFIAPDASQILSVDDYLIDPDWMTETYL